jgi:hypothetical protein
VSHCAWWCRHHTALGGAGIALHMVVQVSHHMWCQGHSHCTVGVVVMVAIVAMRGALVAITIVVVDGWLWRERTAMRPSGRRVVRECGY